MIKITEKQRDVPVVLDCDVLVAGGGIAGVSAALAASRTKRAASESAGSKSPKVILIERECMLGGLATLGLITIFLPLCDGMGNQVSFGLAEELLRLSVKHGAERKYPDAWLENKSPDEKKKQRFEVQYNAHLFALEMEQLLLQENVTILYDSQICNAVTKDNKITHVIVENKSGRTAVSVKAVVDATGDADVCKLSGEKTVDFEQKNLLAGWYYAIENGQLNLNTLGYADIPEKYKDGSDKKTLADRRFTGLDGVEISEMLCLSHEKILAHILSKREKEASHTPVTMPAVPQLRMTRRIEGRYTLDDTQMYEHFSDSVGLISDWRKRGPVYEIPFSVLIGNTVKNLITAGRCISVTDAMWDISRVIPACAVTGEAAGTAAAMTDDFSDFSKMDIHALQNELVRKGVKLFQSQ